MMGTQPLHRHLRLSGGASAGGAIARSGTTGHLINDEILEYSYSVCRFAQNV
ncbi:MAG: hypothetical protein HC800_17920 [Phormidesmis sp. RL_2_1]|nr:hypothetical protein [Phormidesmis sp. RL_2_1]